MSGELTSGNKARACTTILGLITAILGLVTAVLGLGLALPALQSLKSTPRRQ